MGMQCCQLPLFYWASCNTVRSSGLRAGDGEVHLKALMKGCPFQVVVATNIAETSLTIPGIGFVIDCCFAKQAFFNPLTGVPVAERSLYYQHPA